MPLPTRVIDVTRENPILFVSNGLHAPYATLSHCWGNGQPLITTTTTIEAFRHMIPMNQIPKLFQDAISVTRHLGLKYLWIDSLCIVQDSKDDWVREARSMGDVYRGSFLTICALDSQDCHDGILVQRSTPNRHTREHNPPQFAQNALRHRRDVLKSARLCQRGWVVQERMLSPRILSYSKTEMFWECLSCTANERAVSMSHIQPSNYSYDNHEYTGVKAQLILSPGPQPSFPLCPSSDWYIIVGEYTRCHLTRPSDKLPALSGLASCFLQRTQYTYLAGLWVEDFVNGLLWFAPNEQGQRNQQPLPTYRGPSWSWISSDLRIQYKQLTFMHDAQLPGCYDITLLDFLIEYETSNSLGAIKVANAHVEARMHCLSLVTQDDTRRCILLGSDGERLGTGILDAIYFDGPGPLACSSVRVTERTSQPVGHPRKSPPGCLYFLIVVPVPGTRAHDSWQRIGLGWTFEGWRLSGTEKQSIILV